MSQRPRSRPASDGLLRTAVALVVLPTALFFLSLVAIAAALAGASARAVHRVYVAAAKLCVRMAGTRLVTHGEERIAAGQAYVVVANHEGNWDPVALLAALPQLVIRAVAKEQFMDIPVLGQALRLTGNVRVERSRTGEDVKRLKKLMAERPPEVSVLFFAEGTRSRKDELLPFKMGAFVTALTDRLPVLPVAIAGSREVWPPETVRLHRGPVAIEVGAPIPVEGLGYEDRHSLRDRAYEAVAELRARAQRRLGGGE